MVKGEALFIGPTGKLRYFAVPCWSSKSPDMNRNKLKRWEA
jgi:hypothetical protein